MPRICAVHPTRAMPAGKAPHNKGVNMNTPRSPRVWRIHHVGYGKHVAFNEHKLDEHDAISQAMRLYPDAQIIVVEDTEPRFAFYSPIEEKATGGGYWSTQDGWADIESATWFTKEEIQRAPMSRGNDVRLIARTQHSSVPPAHIERIRAYFAQRIEDGAMQIDDIPRLIARYGCMEPGSFLAEMHERIEQSENEE